MNEKKVSLHQTISEPTESTEVRDWVNKQKFEFIANMSHLLRTPLNTIIGYSEMLQEDAESTGLENYNTHLKTVIDSAKQLMTLVNDVLDLSNIETNKMEFFLEDIHVKTLAEEMEISIAPLMKKNNNTFKLFIAPHVDVIHTDALRVRQSLLALVSNANKYTKGGTITLEIKPLLHNDTQMLKFMVTDTGSGKNPIQTEILSQVFSHNKSSLGLHLTKEFCEMLGGWITAESAKVKGSAFSIVLPIKATPGIISTTHSAKLSEISKFKGKTALIIDDTRWLYHEIEHALKIKGFTLLHAFDGEEGLKLAKISRPDVIVLDVPNVITLDETRPLMDSWAMLSTLKTDLALSKIPVIVMTTLSKENMGFNLTAVHYLHKPINVESLISKIKALAFVADEIIL